MLPTGNSLRAATALRAATIASTTTTTATTHNMTTPTPPVASDSSLPKAPEAESGGADGTHAPTSEPGPSSEAPLIRDSWRPGPAPSTPSWRTTPPGSQPPILPPFPPTHAPFHNSAATGFPPRPPSNDGNRCERRAPSEPLSDDRVRDRWSPSWPAEQVQVQYRHEDRTRSGGRFAPSSPSSRGGRSPAHNRNSLGPLSPAPTGSFRGLNSPGRSRQQSPVPVMLPPTPYVELSREDVQFSEEPTPKLLVLDLNGALVYRTAGTGPARKAYPRPFLNCFLQYVFLPEPEGGPRPWDVFVWSSAQPHNVKHMVETTFGEQWIEGVWEKEDRLEKIEREQRGEGRLIGVWARDKMDLGNNYNRKVQTTKDLRKIRDHFYRALNDSRFDENSIVLLDDSPLKAVYQPWSQIAIPEFDKPEHRDSNKAAQNLKDREGVRQPQPESPDAVEDGEKALRNLQSRSASPPTASDIANEPGLDNILLAVIGILEESRYVQNFPAWVRAGGIQYPGENLRKVSDADVTLADLPSHESFEHWFQNKYTHKLWVERGIEALKRKGIEVAHGLNIGAGGEAAALGEGNPGPGPRGGRHGSPETHRGHPSSPPAPRAHNAPGHGHDEAKDGGHEAQIAFNFLKSMADGNRRLNRGQQKALQRALTVLTEMGYGPSPDTPADYSMEGDGAEHGGLGLQWDAAATSTPPPPHPYLPSPNNQFNHALRPYRPDQLAELSHPADGMDVEPQPAAFDSPHQHPGPSTHGADGGVHPDRLRELALNPPSPNAPEDVVDPGVAYAAARNKRGSDAAVGPSNATAGPSKKPKVTAHDKPKARSMFFSPFPDNDQVRFSLGIAPFFQTHPNSAGTVDTLLEADRSDIRFLRRLDDIGLEMTMAQAVAAELLLKKLLASDGYEQDKTTVMNVVALARHRLGLVVAPPGPSLDAVLAEYQALGLQDRPPSKRPVEPNALTRSGRRSMARSQAKDEPLFMSFDDLLKFSGRPLGKAAVAMHKAAVAAAANPKAKGKAAAGKAKAKSTAKVAAKAVPKPNPKAAKKKGGGYDTRQQTESNTLPLANKRQWNAES
ncbi:putative FCP1 y domain-containing protein [Vanrija pseudolonga]|uniref:Purtative FCP1 y domain-containing protein n=1 Tax=Vanrija pseudolonga TaxID=143232 RepID=A0AAF1BFZ2_9TREE|nr:purtative FCP1 y domain-containing protein [Vanrija pseudolonga]